MSTGLPTSTDDFFNTAGELPKEHSTLLVEDVIRVLKAIPKELICLLENWDTKLAITGGFIRDIVRGDKPSDIDIAAVDETAAREAAAVLCKEVGGKTTFAKAHTVTGYRYPIQIFKAFDSTTPQTSYTKHDFTCNGAAVWHGDKALGFNGWMSAHCGFFYPDVAAKRIRILDTQQNYGNCVYRMMKMVHKGYHIEPREHAALLINLLEDVKFNGAMAKLDGNDPSKELTKELTARIASGKYENIFGKQDMATRRAGIDEEVEQAIWQREIIQGIIERVDAPKEPPQQESAP